MLIIRLILFLSFSLGYKLYAQSFNLKKALSYVRMQAKELAELKEREAAYQIKIQSLDAFYDPMISASSSYTQDQLDSQLSNKEKSLNTNLDLSFSKYSRYGTRYQVSLRQNRSDLFFADSKSTTQVGDVNIPIYNPASLYKKNPEYKTSWDLELSQPLYRNHMGREKNLQESVIKSRETSFKHQSELQKQLVQSEIERLFLQYAFFKTQLPLLKKQLELSRLYSRAMEERKEIGRSDSIDVAAAQSAKIMSEGLLLNLSLELKKIHLETAYRLDSFQNIDELKIEFDSLESSWLQEPVKTLKEALTLAKKKRLDLVLYNEQKKPLTKELELIVERKKPSLDFFISANISSLEDDLSSSFKNSFDFEKRKFSFGLQFNMPLGNIQQESRRQEVYYELSAIDAKTFLLIHRIQKELSLTYHEISSAKQQRIQAKRQIAALQNQIRIEQEKYQQARSDKVASLRYEIDLISSRIDLIKSYFSERRAEAKFRLLCHNY